MRRPIKTEKSSKSTKTVLFSVVAKKKFLYEPKKKLVKKTAFFKQNIFGEDKVFAKNLEINGEAAEKALNNQGALYVRTPFNRINLKPHSNNSIDFDVLRVICYSRRKPSSEKQESINLLFNRKLITNDNFIKLFS